MKKGDRIIVLSGQHKGCDAVVYQIDSLGRVCCQVDSPIHGTFYFWYSQQDFSKTATIFDDLPLFKFLGQ